MPESPELDPPVKRPLLSRRRVLGLAAAGAAVGGGALVLGTATDAAALTLESHSEVWDQPTYYEGNSSRTSFRFNPQFYRQCETWLAFYHKNTPYNYLKPMQLWSYGVYVNKPLMHGEGRAFDLTRIYMMINGSMTQTFDARYDRWGGWAEGAAKAAKRRTYWAGVASLNYHFTYVIHYLSNSQHHNHVHFDNQVSGSGLGVFSTGRKTQVYSTQAILRHIWGYSTGIDGIWGPQTNGHSRDVLAKLGRGGGLTTSADNWRVFNHAATQWGTGDRTGPIRP